MRPSAFTSFQPCRLVLPARLSVILRTRLSVHSFSPFVPRLAEMFPSLSPACFQASFLRLRRFFSIDITPSRLPIARTEKFRTTQQSVRFFYWLLSCFRYSKRAPFLSAPSYFFCHSFYSSPRGRRQRTTERRQRGFYDRVSREERKMREIILVLISVPYRRYVDNREFPCRCMARYENEGRSSWSEVLFTLDYVQLLWHRYTVP